MKKGRNPSNFTELRKQAENESGRRPESTKSLSEMSPEAIDSLIHELHVHQIELEMQNDELRRTQLELENTRDRYFDLYNFSPVGYFTISEKGIIEEANLSLATMLGVDRETLTGKPFTRFVLREDQDIFYMHRQRLLETETPQSCDLRLVKKDGHEFYAHIVCTVEKELDGDLKEIRAVVSDITHEKQAEEERERLKTHLQIVQKMEAIGTLAGGIAHNFNNLLMGIQGNVSLLLMDASPVYHNRLKNIEEQIQIGAKLTSQLIGYAKKGQYEVKTISLNPLINEISSTFGQTRKEILIHKKLYKDLFAIEADHGQIEQVLLNLFVNAADAMPGGGNLFLETINVSHRDIKSKLYKPKAGNYVMLTVKDTGVGIDKSNIENIFEPFFTTKDMGRGTGLGLASVYGIIKAHGGYIEVESMKKQGTIFNLYLPASASKFREDIETSDKLIKGSGTVFLVDDEEVVRDICKELLKNIGYSVLSANNGEEAIELYRNNKDEIDIVLLDLIMPNMSGGEVYDRMKEINPEVKVLLSSGYSIDGEATEILNRGCNGFIQKPFDITKLSAKISEILNKK